MLALHGAQRGRSRASYPIIASNIGRIGKPADPSDLAVIESGQPHGEADVARRALRMEDAVRRRMPVGALGTLAVIFPSERLTRAPRPRQQAEKIVVRAGPADGGATR